MLDIALVDPPIYKEVAMPESYQEARAYMMEVGVTMVNIIGEQPDQKNSAQILTAQTIKDIGKGWSNIFYTATDTPGEAEPGEVQFQWQPGGTLSIDFPNSYPDGFCEQAVKPITRASAWRLLMERLDGTEQMDEVQGYFRSQIASVYKGHEESNLDKYVDSAATDMIEATFRQKGNHNPLFDEVEIEWGEGVAACFDRLYADYEGY